MKTKINKFINKIKESKKFRFTFISCLLSVLLLIGATTAWFINVISLNNTNINTGKLDYVAKAYDKDGNLILDLTKKPEQGGNIKEDKPLIDFSNWSANTSDSIYISIENNGTLDMDYKIDFLVSGDNESLKNLGQYWYRIDEVPVDFTLAEVTTPEGQITTNPDIYDPNEINYGPVIKDYNGKNPIIPHSPENCNKEGFLNHTCTEFDKNSNNMATIESFIYKNHLIESETNRQIIRIDYGVRKDAVQGRYTNNKIKIKSDIYATQYGALDNTGGSGDIYTVRSESSLKDAIDSAIPGDSIVLANNVDVNGDLIINKCININTNSYNLKIKGNFIYDFYSNNDLLIDLTNGGSIFVIKDGAIGGDFNVIAPNSNIIFNGLDSISNFYVDSNIILNGTNQKAERGIVLNNVNFIKNDGVTSCDIMLDRNSKLEIGPNLYVNNILPYKDASNLSISNLGTINKIDLTNMILEDDNVNTEFDKDYPQIYIHNYSMINQELILPSWSRKFEQDTSGTKGNTKIVRDFKGSKINISNLNNPQYNNEAVIDKTLSADNMIENLKNEDYTIYYRHKTADQSGPEDTIESIMLDYFKKNNPLLDEESIKGKINGIKKLDIICIGDKELSVADLDYIKNNLIELSSLDLSDASVINDSLPSYSFNGMKLLNEIYLPKDIVAIGGATLGGTKVDRLRIPKHVQNYNNFLYGTSIKFLFFEGTNIGDLDLKQKNHNVYSFVTEQNYEEMKNSNRFDIKRLFKEGTIADDNVNIVRKLPNNTYELICFADNKSNDLIRIGSGIYVNSNPVTISKIGSYAFSNIKENSFDVILSDSIVEIGDYCFANTLIKNIDFNNVNILGINAFENCHNLTYIDTKLIEVIEPDTFRNCSKLFEVYMPNVLEINNYSFGYCANLKFVTFDKIRKLEGFAFKDSNNLLYTYINNITKDGFNENGNNIVYLRNIICNKDIIDDISVHKDYVKFENGDKVGSYIYKKQYQIDGKLVEVSKDIGKFIVKREADGDKLLKCNIENIVADNYTVGSEPELIENGYNIKYIGPYAFYRVSFSSTNNPTLNLKFADNIEEIQYAAFGKKIYNDNSVKKLSINFNNVKILGQYAFHNLPFLKEINKDNKIIYTDEFSFSNCSSLTEVTFENIETVRNNTFKECWNIQKFVFGDKIVSMGWALSNTNPKQVIIKTNKYFDSLRDVRNTFYPIEARPVSIDTFNSARYCYFYDKNELIDNNLLASKETIQYKFNTSFGEQIFVQPKYILRSSNYNGLDGLAIIRYNGSIDSSFRIADNMTTNRGQTKDVIEIGENAFRYYDFSIVKNDENIDPIIGNNIKVINYLAFSESKNLKILNLNNVEIIGKRAFKGASNLEYIYGEKVDKIEHEGFRYMSNLKYVFFNNLSNIDNNAFYDCPIQLLITNATNIAQHGINSNSNNLKIVSFARDTDINEGGIIINSAPIYITHKLNFSGIKAADASYDDLYYGGKIIENKVIGKDGSTFATIKYPEYLFNKRDGKIVLTKYLGDDPNHVIPNRFKINKFENSNNFKSLDFNSTYNGPENDVNIIGKYSFYNKGNLTTTILNKEIERIEQYAFSGSTISGSYNLNKLTHIENNAFERSKINKLIAPNLSNIGVAVFENCKDLTELNLGNIVDLNLRYIPNLKLLTVNNTIRRNGQDNDGLNNDLTIIVKTEKPNFNNMFGNNYFTSPYVLSVPSIVYDSYINNPNVQDKIRRGIVKKIVKFDHSQTVGDTEYIYNILNDGVSISHILSTTNNIVIPETLNVLGQEKNVIAIDKYAFDLLSIDVNNKLTLTLPNNFRYYDKDNFVQLKGKLNKIIVNSNPYYKVIGNGLYTTSDILLLYFGEDDIVTFDNNITSINSNAFLNANLIDKVIFNGKVDYIGSNIFNNQNIASVEFTNAVPPLLADKSSLAGVETIIVTDANYEVYVNSIGINGYNIIKKSEVK